MAKMESYAQRYGILQTALDASADVLIKIASLGSYSGNYSNVGISGGEGQFKDVNSQINVIDELA